MKSEINIFPGMIQNVSDADKNKLANEIEKAITANRKTRGDLERVFRKTNEKGMVVRHSVEQINSKMLYSTFARDVTTTDKLRIIKTNLEYLFQTYNNYVMLKRALTKQRPERIAYHFLNVLNAKSFQRVETMCVPLILLSKKNDVFGTQSFLEKYEPKDNQMTYTDTNDSDKRNAFYGKIQEEEHTLISRYCMDIVDLVGYLNKSIILNHDLYKNNPTISLPSTRYIRKRIVFAILHNICLYTYMYNNHYVTKHSLLEIFNTIK